MPPNHRSILGLTLWPACLAALVWLGGCDGQSKYAPPPPPKVTVANPETRQVTEYAQFTGNTQTSETVDLRARVEGFLLSANFRDGAMVKKGETLFIIDPQTFEAKVRSAEADLNSQQTSLNRAEIELTRAKKLLEERAGPQTDVIKWQAERDSAKANIEVAKSKLELARLDLGYTRLVAPFDGRIGRRLVDPGNLVGASDKTLLATINRLDPIYVYFALNERDLQMMMRYPKVRQESPTRQINAEMALTDDEGYPHRGRLDFMDLGVDAQTGTILLRAVFPNPRGQILPGMFARVRVPLDPVEGILVPETAVGSGQLGHYLLVVNEQNLVEARPVKVGASLDGKRIVTSGLTGGERIVVNGLQKARPGSPVTPEEAPAKPGK
ncbi:MAG: efflux RND transporter periplasmic adaptor subunit [Desulfarculus sp.]|nr:efflux RND transporter periplasmic adaptor subunit [Desulfarculus sp.]